VIYPAAGRGVINKSLPTQVARGDIRAADNAEKGGFPVSFRADHSEFVAFLQTDAEIGYKRFSVAVLRDGEVIDLQHKDSNH